MSPAAGDDSALKVVQALCLAGSVLAASIGCFGFWFWWHTYHENHQVDNVMWLISFYVAAFGVATGLAEVDTPAVFKTFPFLQSRLGRAATYVFIGSLAFVQGVDFKREYDSLYTMAVGGYQMAAGALLAATYLCVPAGRDHS
ncbi:hypothetical protein M885DRAFT_558132 [Pelagophyceae sp. CCMP2097]|nr:hypothetical protein M885DRAFT_558132 [Pelagophyceae sp. CCMP2097]